MTQSQFRNLFIKTHNDIHSGGTRMRYQMKVVLLCLLAALICLLIIIWDAIPSFAAEAQVSWSYSVEEEAKILGYRIYTQDGTPHVQHIDPDQREYTLTAFECETYYMVAYDAYQESDPSNSLVWCPGQLMTPGDFVRKIIFTVNRPSSEEALALLKKKWKEEKK